LALAAVLSSCSGTAPFVPPGSGVALTVQAFRCSGGCAALSGPVDTVQQGDTVLVRLAIADTMGATPVALIRPPCAVTVTILPTCPDSAVSLAVGSIPYLRDVVWIVDGSFAPGDYILRGDIVVNPPVTARRSVHVR
jgi:hypothetical protein